MTVFTEVTYKKKTETGNISISCIGEHSFTLKATGSLPNKKDIIKTIDALYKELDSKLYEKLNTFLIEIKSKRSSAKKRKWIKNRKSVWNYKPGKTKEEFFNKILNGK